MGAEAMHQGIYTARLVSIALGLMMVSGSAASAQDDPTQRFLAVEVFAGALKAIGGDRDSDSIVDGWEVGTSVRLLRALGITGAFGQHKVDHLVSTRYMVVGPSLASSYDAETCGRVFGHVLFGRGSLKGEPSHGRAWTAGVGANFVCVLRFQIDYLRLNLNGAPLSDWRGFVGASVPLFPWMW
jgi:hypothetical protein